jgi:dipeptidyl aminopeptidase/acylaminoacyl peptidase
MMSAIARVVLATAAALLCAAATAAQPVALESLGRFPAMQSVSMSTDGRYLVSLIEHNGEQVLTVRDLTHPEKPAAASEPSKVMKFIGARALKGGKLSVMARQEYNGDSCGENSQGRSVRTFVEKLYFTDTALGRFDAPPSTGNTGEEGHPCGNNQSVVADLPLTADEMIMDRTHYDADTGGTTVEYYRTNLRTGATSLIYRPAENEEPDVWDTRTGQLLAKRRLDPLGEGDWATRTLLRNDSGGYDVHEALTWTAHKRNTVDVVGRDEATGKYYIVTNLFTDKAGVYFYDPKAKQFDKEALFATRDYDVTGVILGRRPSDFNKLLGYRFQGDHERTYYVDPQWASIQSGLEKAFPGRIVDIMQYNDDKSKILFTVSSSTQPPLYYILHDMKKTELVGAERPWIDAKTLRETQLVRYKARDGLEIPAFLTLPKDWVPAKGALPAVVLPHGGPWGRDSNDWDDTGWPQFLASRGYAVIQPQFRGSERWGLALWRAGDQQQWGLKMQDDNDDAAAWLVSQGYADPTRIAIFGYSYGGFAAFAAVVRPGGPFKCAIAGAGVSNLAYIKNKWNEDKFQRAYQGWTIGGMDPLQNTDRASIPVLIFAGDRDQRVPKFNSEDFYNKVKDKAPAKLVIIHDMPHSLPWYPEHARTALKLIEDYLGKDCGLQPAAS